MGSTVLGRKIGMTRVFDEEGASLPVTVIQAGPCFVSQIKTQQRDGYDAVQLAIGDVKARNSTNPLIGHDAKAGLTPKRERREFRVSPEEAASFELGQEIGAGVFGETAYVDVIGTSKGRGFAGVIRRHGFKGQLATHGVERKHRSPGAIAGRASNLGTGKNKKGIKMPGQMGDRRVTVRSLPVVQVDPKKNLILVKGAVPGAKNGLVMIREAVRLYGHPAQG